MSSLKQRAVLHRNPLSLTALVTLATVGCGDLPSSDEGPPVTPPSTTARLSAPGGYSVTLEPISDAQVTPSAPDTNYGQYSAWEVNRHFSHVYLKFDLSSVPLNARIRSVSLSATAYHGVSHGGDGNVYTTFVPHDGWYESSITWNNKPAAEEATLGEWNLLYGGPEEEEKLGVNSSPALIPVVQGALDGDSQLSLRLHSPGYKTRYRSREYADASKRPRLVITYDLVTVLTPEADTYVQEDPFDRTTDHINYGHLDALFVRFFAPSDTYLRFNLGDLPPGTVVKSVRLTATSVRQFPNGGDAVVGTLLEPNNTWGEYTLTYANRPTPSRTALGSWFIANSHNVPLDRLCVNDSPALTPVVQNASNATDRRVSFRLINDAGYLTYYYSREYPDASKHPRLEIFY